MSALNAAARSEVAYVRQTLDRLAGDTGAAEKIGRLQGCVDILLRIIDGLEAPPKSVRLAAQHDAEFLNLARAARMEIHAAIGALRRLDSYEQHLSGMIWPEDGGR